MECIEWWGSTGVILPTDTTRDILQLLPSVWCQYITHPAYIHHIRIPWYLILSHFSLLTSNYHHLLIHLLASIFNQHLPQHPILRPWQRPWRSPASVGKLLKFIWGTLDIHKQGSQPTLSLTVDHHSETLWPDILRSVCCVTNGDWPILIVH